MNVSTECSICGRHCLGCGKHAESLFPISLRRSGDGELWNDDPVCLGCIALWRADGWTCEIIDPAAQSATV